MPELKATNEGIKLKGDHSIAKYLLGENEKRKKKQQWLPNHKCFFPATAKEDLYFSYTGHIFSCRRNNVGIRCWKSFLQHHQLTGTHEGIATDVSKLFVAFQRPVREEEKKDMTYLGWLFLVNRLFPIVRQSLTHNLCIFVPLKASLATSLMPFLVSRLSSGGDAKLWSRGLKTEHFQQ